MPSAEDVKQLLVTPVKYSEILLRLCAGYVIKEFELEILLYNMSSYCAHCLFSQLNELSPDVPLIRSISWLSAL